MRESTIIYRSFYDAIIELPKETQAEVWEAIFEYSLNFKSVELNGLAKTIFTLIKPQLDANIKRYENGSKPKQKQQISKTEAKDKQETSKVEANKNVNDNDKVNEKENKNKKFVPPSLQEVEMFFSENGFGSVYAKQAFDYYELGEWKDASGKQVKNWKQKMKGVWLTEEKRNKSNVTPTQTTQLKPEPKYFHNQEDYETALAEWNAKNPTSNLHDIQGHLL